MVPRLIVGGGLLFLILAGLSNQQNKPDQTDVTPNVTINDTQTSTQSEAQTAPQEPQRTSERDTQKQCHNLNVGYTETTINGRSVVLWYPTQSTETTHYYTPDFSSELAVQGTPSQCEQYPLIVFSHGLAGCKTQSTFFTEELARAGYVVVAPDHQDSLCQGDGVPVDLSTDASFLKPEQWTTDSEIDRRNDVKEVISGILGDNTWNKSIDADKIGVAGHSLGGYTALALAGAWNNWKDDRVDAVLVMSPYVMPFIEQGTLKNIDIPVMYQGAMFDIGITPTLKGVDGAYEQTPSPAHYIELLGGTHFEWTNILCIGKKTSQDCIASNGNIRLINKFGIGFFDTYLKGASASSLKTKWGLAENLSK